MAEYKDEAEVKKATKKLLTNHGAMFYMPVPTGYGVRGVHDFICCYQGLYFTIETKAPGRRGEPNRGMSGPQVTFAEGVVAAGGAWFVVDGDEDLLQVAKFLVDNRNR